jgi:integrase
MALTDKTISKLIRDAKATGKAIKKTDGHSLYVWCSPAGNVVWRYKFSFGNREQTGVIGTYPEYSIKEARDAHFEAKRMLQKGINPNEQKKAAKSNATNSFEQVADEYIKLQEGKLKKRTIDKARWQLREFINPHLGRKPINEISAPALLAVIRKIEVRGKIETAHKTKELCGRVFLYGIASGLCERNVAADLKLALKPRPTDQHLAAVTDPAKVGALLRALDAYSGQPATSAALRLAPHVFLRPGELRAGRWVEIDLDAALWRIPAERMKMKREHLVPLSRQSLAILESLKEITGTGEWIFPAIGPKRRCISENTLGTALRAIGYTPDQMVPHGFRSMASTLLHELGFVSTDIELQLAHADKNKIRAVYNRSERIKERTKMMQQWSDYLDSLRSGGNVVPFKRRA